MNAFRPWMSFFDVTAINMKKAHYYQYSWMQGSDIG